MGLVSFKYDPFGRRIYKSSSNGTSIFAYDGDNLVEETNAAGGVVARYAQGLNIDEPLAMLRSSATSYYNADGLGSITSLANGSGTLTQTYTYDSFGKVTASSGSLVNSFQYAAREFDPEVSLLYYRARYYEPVVGRFLSEDPDDHSSLDETKVSLYAYVRNNAANYVDPTGLYGVKAGVPAPSPVLDALLKCIEARAGVQLFVTSTAEPIRQHPEGTPHRLGVAVDVRYQPGNADKILCSAGACGAGYGLDEAKHPSPQSTGDHIHLQIPEGRNGGHGDIPSRCYLSGRCGLPL